MTLWWDAPVPELKTHVAGHLLGGERFDEVLARLAVLHRQEVNDAASQAVSGLQQENLKLREELGIMLRDQGAPLRGQRPQCRPRPVEAGGFRPAEAGALGALAYDGPRIAAMLPGMITEPDSPAPIINGQQRPSTAENLRRFSEPMNRHSMELNKAVEKLNIKNKTKQVRRFRAILNLSRSTEGSRDIVISARDVQEALVKRKKKYSDDRISEILQELSDIRDDTMSVDMSLFARCSHVPSSSSRRVSIPFLRFVELMMIPNLPELVSPEMQGDVGDIQQALLAENDLECLIEAATQGARNSDVHEEDLESDDSRCSKKVLSATNSVAMIVVILSLVTLGLSMDYQAEWLGWLLIEGSFTVILVAEVVIKLILMGYRKYLCGGEKYFNWLDMVITGIAAADLVITIATYGDDKTMGSKITMLLRAFRIARIARLVKLMRSPLLRELADMLTGFIIGMPWLIWVMVLLFVIIYSLGLIFRVLIGPNGDEEKNIWKCGSADVADTSDPDCKEHQLLSEEFFGTVVDSMFTLFRCMVGDCSTKLGQSLVVHFSQGFGMRFQLLYALGMIVVIFGLFNIITALFVEATLSGLKSNDTQMKYRSMYDSRYVQKRLKELVERVTELVTQMDRRPSLVYEQQDGAEEKAIKMSESVFVSVMQDSKVGKLFDELDVSTINREGLFDIFDPDGDGSITITELVETLLKLRGEPQKCDAVASFVTLRRLRDNLSDFMFVVLDNQKQMMKDQQGRWDALWEAIDSGSLGPNLERTLDSRSNLAATAPVMPNQVPSKPPSRGGRPQSHCSRRSG